MRRADASTPRREETDVGAGDVLAEQLQWNSIESTSVASTA
jgi:hypothetical protein